ncbi:hypothetical protein C791_2245 [Amycolatopsis azurea DSM 43854]|uniref:Uncharacterized protein n=1 Tax=Amycolatopsis azurea DSM 43854 TaxID=1238180 RepID=M2PRL1_9PSEU|nr:hypothetical protein C791_2245 [Amycolatopsis azurea DSM 43854]
MCSPRPGLPAGRRRLVGRVPRLDVDRVRAVLRDEALLSADRPEPGRALVKDFAPRLDALARAVEQGFRLCEVPDGLHGITFASRCSTSTWSGTSPLPLQTIIAWLTSTIPVQPPHGGRPAAPVADVMYVIFA